MEQLLKVDFEPPALVFLQTKDRAGSLFVELQKRCPKIPIRLISSELTNEARDKILDKFKSGEVLVLITTEMLGRGLDLPNVNFVVNFDLPNSIIQYIHRVGRTGRAGRTGRSVTFFSYNDLKIVRPISTVIKQAGGNVPQYTLELDKLTRFEHFLKVRYMNCKICRKERKFLLKHAPKRRNVGSVGQWKRAKKTAIKNKIIKRDPKPLHEKKNKEKKEGSVEKPVKDGQKKSIKLKVCLI